MEYNGVDASCAITSALQIERLTLQQIGLVLALARLHIPVRLSYGATTSASFSPNQMHTGVRLY